MKRVLIADDAMFMRATLKRLLEKNGYDVVGEAENGRVAYEKYLQLLPDIVTMDITMPEMDGLEALKKIMETNRAAKVVMISAVGQEDKVKTAIISGARNFILKPFKDENVIKTLGVL